MRLVRWKYPIGPARGRSEGRRDHARRARRAGPPLPALPPVAGRNARLIGIVFFETVERSGIEAETLHQGAGRKTAFKKFIRREEGESLILGQGRQAGESQMQLREKLFAAALEVQGFSHDIEDLRGYDAPKGRRSKARIRGSSPPRGLASNVPTPSTSPSPVILGCSESRVSGGARQISFLDRQVQSPNPPRDGIEDLA